MMKPLDGVAILFEASPGFQRTAADSTIEVVEPASQSSLKRVLVSNPAIQEAVNESN